jgi:hypothetical protein
LQWIPHDNQLQTSRQIIYLCFCSGFQMTIRSKDLVKSREALVATSSSFIHILPMTPSATETCVHQCDLVKSHQ